MNAKAPVTHEVEFSSRVKLHWLRDALAIAPPPQLVSGLIPAGGLVLLYGESGTGKSTLAADIGLHVAAGKLWRNRAVQKGLVLHIAGEGLYGLQARLAAAVRAGVTEQDALYAVISCSVDLVQPGDLDELLEVIALAESECGAKAGLVIVDTLARCFGIDENDGAQMRLAIVTCEQFQVRTGAAVLLVHHCGKDVSKGARGHSSLRAAVDSELLVEGRCNPRTLTVTKQRDLPTAEPMAFDLDPSSTVRAALVRKRPRPASSDTVTCRH